MENNGKSKTAKSDTKSMKRNMVRSKSQTECQQDCLIYLLINNSLRIELFIVRKL